MAQRIVSPAAIFSNYQYVLFSCLFITFKGEWLFKNFDRTNPASFNNDMLLLSTTLSIFSMFKGLFVGIRAVRRIRECLNKMQDLNVATLCKALENEKECQKRPKMAIEYQPAFSDESDKKIVTAHVYLDSTGKVEKTEIALPNGNVLKSTLEKKDLN